jgi:hypothetical protein
MELYFCILGFESSPKVWLGRDLLVLEALTSWKAIWGTSRCLKYGLFLKPNV